MGERIPEFILMLILSVCIVIMCIKGYRKESKKKEVIRLF